MDNIEELKSVKAWIPVVDDITKPVHDNKDKYGGLPYIKNGMEWPKCKTCQEYMHFLVQFSSNEKDLYQVFVCFSDSDCYENDESHLVQKIIPNGSSEISSKIPKLFDQKYITKYTIKEEKYDEEDDIYTRDKFYGIPPLFSEPDDNTLLIQLETEGNTDFHLADSGYIFVFENKDGLELTFYND